MVFRSNTSPEAFVSLSFSHEDLSQVDQIVLKIDHVIYTMKSKDGSFEALEQTSWRGVESESDFPTSSLKAKPLAEIFDDWGNYRDYYWSQIYQQDW